MGTGISSDSKNISNLARLAFDPIHPVSATPVRSLLTSSTERVRHVTGEVPFETWNLTTLSQYPYKRKQRDGRVKGINMLPVIRSDRNASPVEYVGGRSNLLTPSKARAHSMYGPFRAPVRPRPRPRVEMRRYSMSIWWTIHQIGKRS